MIEVLLVDDVGLFREAIRRLIERQVGVAVVGEASDSKSALAQAERLRPDVILLDVQMPGMGSIETVRALKDLCPTARVIMLTAEPSRADALALIDAGADGYLTSSSAASELPAALEKVLQGERYLAAEIGN